MANENGLDISEEQFMKMSSKERDLAMFRNITHIRRKFREYALNKKIQYVWLTVLTIITATLLGFGGYF